MSNLVEKILWGILLFLAIGACVLTLLPRIFGVEPLIVKSGSMEPEIPTGSLAYVDRRYPAEKIRENDVIAYRAGNGTQVLHRVIEKQEEQKAFLTKGDANDTMDVGVVSYGDYAGKEVGHLPFVGYFLSGIRSPAGWAGCFLLLGSLWMIKRLCTREAKHYET